MYLGDIPQVDFLIIPNKSKMLDEVQTWTWSNFISILHYCEKSLHTVCYEPQLETHSTDDYRMCLKNIYILPSNFSFFLQYDVKVATIWPEVSLWNEVAEERTSISIPKIRSIGFTPAFLTTPFHTHFV